MDIRNMRLDDYDSVYALWLSCPGMGLNNLDDSREGIAKYLARNPDTCFVAVEQDSVVGVILTGHDGRRGYISHTAVSPEWQRQGIGKQLVDAALNALKEQGINKVCLVAFADNEKGNAFWEKLGFTQRTDLIYRNRALVDMVRIDTQQTSVRKPESNFKKKIKTVILSFLSFFSALWANVLLNLMPLGSPGSTSGKWMLMVMYLFYCIVFLFNMFVVFYCKKTQEEQQTSKIPVWISTAGTILYLIVALFLSVGITIVQVTGGV